MSSNVQLTCTRAARLAIVACALAVAPLALAKPSFWDRFVAFYQPAKGSALEQATCKTCHNLETGPPLRNAYGKRVEKLINHANDGTLNGGVTTDVMIFVEKEDTDGDGFTNLEEIVSGNLPGDPDSKPASHPTNLPKHEMTRKFQPLHVRVTGCLLLAGTILIGAGKAAKKASFSKVGLGVGILGIIALAGTMAAWFLSNRHP